jgi:hypothetical protein
MMVAATDDRGPSGVEDAEFMANVFTEHGAKEVFSTADPEEGEAFVAARRFSRSRRWRRRAHSCSRTLASRCPPWPIWSARRGNLSAI